MTFAVLGAYYYKLMDAVLKQKKIGPFTREVKCLMQRKFKITISFFQVVTAIPVSYPVDFDIEFNHIIGYFNIVNLQINEVLPVTCLAELDYYDRYLLKALAPLALSAVFYTLYSMNTLIREVRRRLMFKIYLFFLFAIFPAMSATGGETLRCLTTSDDGQTVQRWLKVDYSINCDTQKHQDFLVIDILFMLLYSLGIPLFFFLLLWQEKDTLSERTDRLCLPERVYHLEALCITYENTFWWFEVAECIRKYMLVSVCISVFHSYPSSAILTAIVVCAISLLISQELAPYEFDYDDVLAYLANCMLLIIFLLAAYTRFSNIITNISSEDIVGDKEVFLWKNLVIVASYLVLFIVVFAFASAMYESKLIWQNVSDECVVDNIEIVARSGNMELISLNALNDDDVIGADRTSKMRSRDSSTSMTVQPSATVDSGGLWQVQDAQLTRRLSKIEAVLQNKLGVTFDSEPTDEFSFQGPGTCEEYEADSSPQETEAERAQRIRRLTQQKLAMVNEQRQDNRGVIDGGGTNVCSASYRGHGNPRSETNEVAVEVDAINIQRGDVDDSRTPSSDHREFLPDQGRSNAKE